MSGHAASHQPILEGPPRPDYLEGMVFHRRGVLLLWIVLAGLAALANLLIYGWSEVDLGPVQGPTLAERTSIAGHLTVCGWLYAAAAVAFLYGARGHARIMLAPWLLLSAVAAIHLLLGVPALVNGVNAGGGGHVPFLTWLNPLTYLLALPALLTVKRRANWRYLLPKAVALLILASVATLTALARS